MIRLWCSRFIQLDGGAELQEQRGGTRCDTESMHGLGVTTGGCGVRGEECGVWGVGRVRYGLGVT